MGFELSSESNKFEQARTLLAFLKRRQSLETSVDASVVDPEWLFPDPNPNFNVILDPTLRQCQEKKTNLKLNTYKTCSKTRQTFQIFFDKICLSL
jgi:hypothetical protein